MQSVYTARDAMDAHFLKGLLEQEGIEAVVQGEALQEAWGNLPLSDSSLPSVWVDEANVPKAMPIVLEYRRRDEANADPALADAPRPTWICSKCGEQVEAQFSACWKCGESRPTAAGN